MSLCLVAFGRLALAEGETERAALLAGAADGLRGRAGVRAWPMLRQPETELVAEVREALGTSAFDQAFTAGSRLSRQQAAAAARENRSSAARAA